MKSIVKVTIKGSSGYGPVDLAYEDKVTVDEHSISYQYKPVEESDHNPSRKWSYRTNSPIFMELFSGVVSAVHEIMQRDEEPFCTDIGYIEFAVVFEDKTKWKKMYWCPGDDFKDCFSFIKQMVPSCEKTPEVLLTSEDYEEDDSL